MVIYWQYDLVYVYYCNTFTALSLLSTPKPLSPEPEPGPRQPQNSRFFAADWYEANPRRQNAKRQGFGFGV